MYLYVQKFITNIKLNRDLININVNCKKEVEWKNLQTKRVENFGTHAGY